MTERTNPINSAYSVTSPMAIKKTVSEEEARPKPRKPIRRRKGREAPGRKEGFKKQLDQKTDTVGGVAPGGETNSSDMPAGRGNEKTMAGQLHIDIHV